MVDATETDSNFGLAVISTDPGSANLAWIVFYSSDAVDSVRPQLQVSGYYRSLFVPNPVASLAASDNLCDSVVITWLPVLIGNPSLLDSYQVRRDGDRIGVTDPDVLTFTDLTATVGTEYEYTVAAYNMDSCYTPTASDSGGWEYAAPPSVVTGVSATDNRMDSVVVTWDAPVNADSLFVLRDTVPVDTLSGDAIRYADHPAVGTYSYQVIAANVCGKADTSEVAEGTLLPTEDTETEQEQGWGNSWNGSWGSGGWGK